MSKYPRQPEQVDQSDAGEYQQAHADALECRLSFLHGHR